MFTTKLTKVGATFGLVAALAGCDEIILAERAGEDSSISAEGTTAVATSETREVERSDIFAANEEGLWDGRPSLGGVWVAHPDVTDPERVRITVPETGRTVTGALFRRERNNPGPRIQVSSDAAAALGMLGGQPAVLEVVVLRTETIEIAPPPAPEPEVVEDTPEVEDFEVTDGVDAAEGAAVAAATVAAIAPEPRRPSFWDRLTGRNRAAEDATATAAEEAEVAAGEDLTVTAEPAPAVEETPLDAVAVAAAAIARAEAEEAPEAEVSEVAAEDAAPGTLATPYIQVGVFSDETDADAAATALRQSGIPPIIKPLTNDSGTLWRVLVGPILSDEEKDTLLKDVKSMGYPDAFPTAD